MHTNPKSKKNVKANEEQNIDTRDVLQSITEVSRERGLSEDSVIEMFEDAMRRLLSRANGNVPVSVKINRKAQNIEAYLIKDVVEEPKYKNEVSLEDALKLDPEAEIEGTVNDAIDIEQVQKLLNSRTLAFNARKSLEKNLTVLEKEKEYEYFREKVGEFFLSPVKRREDRYVVLDLIMGEGYLFNSDVIDGEKFRVNQKIKACIKEVKQSVFGIQVLLTRTSPEFLGKLFEEAVPEIQHNIITIKSIARSAGNRSKIAVHSNDPEIDPVGACIGKGNMRIRSVEDQISKEKIDIVRWSENTDVFLVNALGKRIDALRVIKDEDNSEFDIVVRDEDYYKVIGSKGQNIRLIKDLVGCNITIIPESKYSNLKQETIEELAEIGVSEIFAENLYESGIPAYEFLAYATDEEMLEYQSDLSENEMDEIRTKAFDKNKTNQIKTLKEDFESTLDIDLHEKIGFYEACSLSEKEIYENIELVSLSPEELNEILSDYSIEDCAEIIKTFANKPENSQNEDTNEDSISSQNESDTNANDDDKTNKEELSSENTSTPEESDQHETDNSSASVDSEEISSDISEEVSEVSEEAEKSNEKIEEVS
ncbi:transcription termination factor NusA [Candidatus Nesciobacter abundans]|uniref:Transcription termination/antitermination protein NusA n=1 Tax=Candidatus Nesciobacter abundans TaxID=2601668 RepID=A0A5C0UHI3_9PROT|nr:transcription termination factor NusA [Candidatus Nesciobacter abundans]QEK39151.1 transcription termination factor NusA [Candidatus Nesciobacter abundans]